MKLPFKSRRVLSLYSIVSLGAILLCGASGALAQQGHTLIAQYTFDVNSEYYQADSSGNNNNINGGSFWVSNPVWGWTTDAIAGGGALVLDGGENVSFGSPPGNQTFDNWLATLYGSFSISLWINTTNIVGNDTDAPNGGTGASIIWAYSYGYNDTIPIALTGHKVAFFTGDPTSSSGDTLHSTNNVTTGTYVHIVVTRDQSSGQKMIYINGALDSSDSAVTNNLDGDTGYYAIGGVGGSSYKGILDDVQVYSGVLDANEVAYLYNNPGMTATNVVVPGTGLVAYYDFDENTDLAADLTANGNNLIYGGNFGGPVISSNAISGSGAVFFNGGSFLTPSSNLLSTLAGNFSLSIWVKTTQSIAWDTAPAWYGAGIVAADLPGTTNDLIPMSLTGGAIAFNTGSDTVDDTINSSATDINDGNYHHVVVTRNRTTGEKQIYIDGEFSVHDFATTDLLNAPQLITIGALADASRSDPTSPEYSGYNGFVGLIDDIQIYSRVLSGGEVAELYATPGSNVTNGLVCHYDFDEGTVLAKDVSGNGNDMVFAGNLYNNAPGPAVTADAESGPGALSFDGGSYLVPEGNLVTNLAGDFSLSVWLQTTQTFGTETEPAWQGAGIVTAEVPGQSDDLIPLALTGGNIAFETDGNNPDVLTSTTAINDGIYHHLVVTRDQGTGQKQIYIDGVLNVSDTDDGSYLNAPQILIFGALADASQSDPNSPSQDATNGYVGLMDQVQIYSRVLSSSEVAYLFANPGSTVPTNGGSSASIGHTNVAWYSFADDTLFAHDFSGNGNNIGGYAWFQVAPYMTNDDFAGTFSVGFADDGWLSLPTNNLVATVAGSFSASLWVRTSDDPGEDSDTADQGSGLLAANSDQVIPLALTGSKLAFLTGGSTPDTLHSVTSINTGSYVHIVATRDAITGNKEVYVNGNLDASDVGATGPLSSASPVNLWLGMNTTFAHGFVGDMTEVQIYSGVLSAADVTFLYHNPGTNVANTTGQELPGVTLVNPTLAGSNFQFSFLSTAGTTNYVEYSTNLANPNWLPYSTIVGDGTLKTVTVPVTGPAAEFFRVNTE